MGTSAGVEALPTVVAGPSDDLPAAVAVVRHPFGHAVVSASPAAGRTGTGRAVPTVCVVEGRKLRKRIESPRGCLDLERELAPWLR